eukprot:s2601_g4.t1
MRAFFSGCLEVLREGSMVSLNFVQNKRFQDWRKIFVQERLEGKPVTEELVGLGLAVERGPDWHYDTSEDDKTPEDGGSEGFGLVVGWRTKSGRPHGPKDSVPDHSGWVRVQWCVTGFQKSYRLGPAHDLKFASVKKLQTKHLENVQKGMLKLQHLRCDFGYRCGTKYCHYAKFDIRKEACQKVADFVHGDVVEDMQQSARRSTCIGLKYNAEKKKVEMWFHFHGAKGAGIFAGADLDSRFRRVDHVQVREDSREDVDGASDGEIEHDERDWVCRNLEPSLQYQSKGGHMLDVDTRPEMISKFKMPFKSGDVIRDKADGELMTCIGVAFRPGDDEDREYRKAEVWFHVESSKGAGINPNVYKNLGRFEVVRNVPVVGQLQDMNRKDMPSVKDELAKLKGKLKCDFSFPSGTRRADDELFDVRDDVLEKITGWKPGTVLTVGAQPDTRLTLIGLRPDPASDDPKVWWHFQDEEETHHGAGMLPQWESMRAGMQETGERVDLVEFRSFLKTLPGADARQGRPRGPGVEALMSQLGALGGLGEGPLEDMLRQALRREL